MMLVRMWDGLTRMEGVSRPPEKPYEDMAAAITRDALIEMWPNEQKHWIQKPINVWKHTFGGRVQDMGWDGTMKWFWRMMIKTFPAGEWLTILRDPRDIVASHLERWKTSKKLAWISVTSQYEIITHPASMVREYLVFEQMIDDYAGTVNRLLDWAGLPFNQACLDAATQMYVPGSRKTIQEVKQHRDWSNIGEPNFLQKASLDRSFEFFGQTIDW